MDFKTFKANVEKWAEVRCIYEQSTEANQRAKALEEIGEYLTAETDDERIDAIGDIAVCIVNAAYLCLNNLDDDEFYGKKGKEDYIYSQGQEMIRYHCRDRGFVRVDPDDGSYDVLASIASEVVQYCYGSTPFYLLYRLCEIEGYDFYNCLEKAWNAIKDRKGKMVNGLYVEWENLTEEQREEFRLRDC